MTIIAELRAVLPDDEKVSYEDTWEYLRHRVTILSARAWEGKQDWPAVERWLSNFVGKTGLSKKDERIHALFLLSQFLYIGSVEIRVLQRALFRDLFVIPLLQELKTKLSTRNPTDIAAQYHQSLSETRFLGIGNPSESGVHLLYYFRQENGLSKHHFLDGSQIMKSAPDTDGNFVRSIGNPDVKRYVFVDDVCGSGVTAKTYSDNNLRELVSYQDDVKLHYFSMFATREGLKKVRDETLFGDNSGAVFELDDSYKCVSEGSRYLRSTPPYIDRASVNKIAEVYGRLLVPNHPLGYDDGQMLIGFHHNTPDNTLPIIWKEGDAQNPWTPAFRRYPKI